MAAWMQLRPEGAAFGARKNHAAACVGPDEVWVFGGLTAAGLSADLLQLTITPSLTWRHRTGAGGVRPPPTVLHTMVTCEADCIVFGGLVECADAATAATDGLWLLHTGLPEPHGCAWSAPQTAGEPPCPRIGHAAAVRDLGGGAAQMFVYGGFVPERVAVEREVGTRVAEPSSSSQYLNDFAMLSLPAWAWSRPNISVDNCCPPPCTSATLSALAGTPYLLLFGGVERQLTTDVALLLDAESMSICPIAVPPLPDETGTARRTVERCNHTATLVGGELFVYGGSAGGWEFDDTLALDVRTLEWRRVSPAGLGEGVALPLPRQRHAAVAVRSGVLVLGGSCGERLLDEVQMLRLDSASASPAQQRAPQQAQPAQQPAQQPGGWAQQPSPPAPPSGCPPTSYVSPPTHAAPPQPQPHAHSFGSPGYSPPASHPAAPTVAAVAGVGALPPHYPPPHAASAPHSAYAPVAGSEVGSLGGGSSSIGGDHLHYQQLGQLHLRQESARWRERDGRGGALGANAAAVSASVAVEVAGEVLHQVRSLAEEISSGVARHVSSEIGPQLSRLRLATDSSECRARELTDLMGQLAQQLAHSHRTAADQSSTSGAALVQLRSELAAARSELMSTQQQLGGARAEAAHWQRLHMQEVSRNRELERTAELLQEQLATHRPSHSRASHEPRDPTHEPACGAKLGLPPELLGSCAPRHMPPSALTSAGGGGGGGGQYESVARHDLPSPNPMPRHADFGDDAAAAAERGARAPGSAPHGGAEKY